MKFLKIITFPLKIILIIPIYFYKFCISPLLPHTCRFYPTCSSYALTAIKKFGPFTGMVMAIKRIFRCSGKNKGGFDLVPENIKGEFKWLI